MRYREIASGMRLVVHSEEQDIIDGARDGIIKGIPKDDKRKLELVRSMLAKDLLTLIKVDGKPVVAVNSIDHIWRSKNDR